MRIMVSDYSGHPFQVQLSRALANRGHDVLHVYSASFQTPKGNLLRQPGDPQGFAIRGLKLERPFLKSTFVRRRAQEMEFGRLLAAECAAFAPDVVISSNAPLDVQRLFQRAAQAASARFVFWLQDIYSTAIRKVVPRKLPLIGHLVAAHYERMEFRLLRRSDHVVAITPDFVPILAAHGIAHSRITTIGNWAPLEELPVKPRDNPWATEHFGDAALRIVYSGTLGYKHDPGLLLALAAELPGAAVFVFSEGTVADALAAEALRTGLANLTVRSWVPFATLPDMLGGADIFVAVIEEEAGIYSVPSKILTYLAAGRPVLASVPPENLAARLIVRQSAGLVASPGDRAAFLMHARALAGSCERRRVMGANGRSYAEATFDIETITDAFEGVIG